MLLYVSHDDINALDAHLLGVQNVRAETVVRYNCIRVFLGGFNELLECRLRLLLVGFQKLGQWHLSWPLLVGILEHSAAESHVIIGVDENAQIKQVS